MGGRPPPHLLDGGGGVPSKPFSPSFAPVNGSCGSSSGGDKFVHPLLRRRTLRSTGGLIYLYIVLRNNASSILLTIITVLGLISFLRPLPALSSFEGFPGTPSLLPGQRKGGSAGGVPSGPGRGWRRGSEAAGGGPGAGAGAIGSSVARMLHGSLSEQQQQQQPGREAQQPQLDPHTEQQRTVSASPGGYSFSSRSPLPPPPPPPQPKQKPLLSLLGAKKDELLSQLRRDPDSALVREAVRQQHFREHAPVFAFVHYSSYRMSPVQFAALGFSALAMRGTLRLGSCLWKEKHGGHRVHGNLTALYPGEHHELKYEALVVLCHLEESTESDYGGVLLYTVDGEDILVYVEDKGEFPSAIPRPPYTYQLTYCTPPLTGNLSPRRVYEWVEYHLHMGMDRMVVYDAGAVDQDLVAVLEAFREKGVSIQIVDFRQVKGYASWDTGRLLATNDCIYRHRYTSKWVFLAEMSEYFSAENGVTLLGLLNLHEGNPYVSLGSRWWSLERCLPADAPAQAGLAARGGAGGGGDSSSDRKGVGEGYVVGSLDPAGWTWAVERMVFHWPHFYCTNKKDYPKAELCPDYHGFRRYAVDPRMVSSAQIHRTEVPRLGGLDVDAEVARLNRYQGILEESPAKECTKPMKVTEVVDWWVKDRQVALLAKEVKQQPHALFKVPARGTQ